MPEVTTDVAALLAAHQRAQAEEKAAAEQAAAAEAPRAPQPPPQTFIKVRP